LPEDLPQALKALILQHAQEATSDVRWVVSADELEQYSTMFQHLDSQGSGAVGADEGRELFELSGLPVAELSHIWQIADLDGDGRLARKEFICAMAIVARRRLGLPLPPSASAALQQLMLDSPGGVAAISDDPNGFAACSSAVQSLPKPDNSGFSVPNAWAVATEELALYRAKFQETDPMGTGFAGWSEVKTIFEQSKLPHSELSAIYSVADLDKDGRLAVPRVKPRVENARSTTSPSDPSTETGTSDSASCSAAARRFLSL